MIKLGTLNPRAAYELWAATYPAVAHNPVMRAEQSIVEPLLLRLPARRALDVGTGSGRYLAILASTGASVVGVDLSRAMLTAGGAAVRGVATGGVARGGAVSTPARAVAGAEPARPAAARAGVGAECTRPRTAIRVCGDACRLPFRRGAFNLINASLMVGDIADLGAWTREMARALALGGHLVYSDFHPSWTEHGWRRTFQSAGGATHTIAFEPHAIAQHLDALAAAGLHVEAIREPRLPDEGDASVRAFKRRWGNPPVVAVFHAIKEP